MFIVLEGGEGSGKTTAAITVKEWLEARGHTVDHTREPGGTPDAENIRSLLLSERTNLNPISQCLLFAAARVDHVEKRVKPQLAKGITVLSDRFVLSTIAYQGAAGNVPREFIMNLHNQTTGGFWPDLTVILDIDPEVGIARSKKRLAKEGIDEGYFENLDIDFHRQVRQSLLDAAEADDSTVVVDADASIEQVKKRIEDVLAKALDAPDKKGDDEGEGDRGKQDAGGYSS